LNACHADEAEIESPKRERKSKESKHLLQWQAYLEFTLNSEV